MPKIIVTSTFRKGGKGGKNGGAGGLLKYMGTREGVEKLPLVMFCLYYALYLSAVDRDRGNYPFRHTAQHLPFFVEEPLHFFRQIYMFFQGLPCESA